MDRSPQRAEKLQQPSPDIGAVDPGGHPDPEPVIGRHRKPNGRRKLSGTAIRRASHFPHKRQKNHPLAPAFMEVPRVLCKLNRRGFIPRPGRGVPCSRPKLRTALRLAEVREYWLLVRESNME